MIDRNLNYGRHLIHKFLSGSDPYDVVLDLGAGKGIDLQIAKEVNSNCRAIALESYGPYVQILQGKGIEVFSANIEKDKLPFEDNSVDVIIMNQIMEHVKEVFWILHEVTRVLKRNGSFIVGVPNLASLHNRILLLFGKQPTIIKNSSAHVRGYTLHDFRKLLESGHPQSWELVAKGGSNFYPFPHLIARPLANLIPSMAWGLFMHWKKINDYQDGYLKFPSEKRLETNFYLG
jgi:SAM-dependent methyltransferase